MNYRYFLIKPTGEVEIHPINSDRSKKYTLQSDGYYREELSGTIKLRGSELSIIQTFEQSNTKLFIKIEEFYNGTWNHYYKGYFFPWDCEFDLDECTVSIKLKVDDLISTLTEKMNERINVMDLFRTNGTVEVRFVGNGEYEETYNELSDYYFPIGSLYINGLPLMNINDFRFYAMNTGEEVPGTTTLLLGNEPSPCNLQIFTVADPLTKYIIKRLDIVPVDRDSITWVSHPTISNIKYNSNAVQCTVTVRKVRQTRYVVGENVAPSSDYILVDTIIKQNTTIYKFAKYPGIVGNGSVIKYKYKKQAGAGSLNSKVGDATWFVDASGDYLPDFLDTEIKLITNRHARLREVLLKLYQTAINDTTKLVMSDLIFGPLSLIVTPSGADNYQVNPLSGQLNKYVQFYYHFVGAGVEYTARDIILIQKSDYKYPTATERATIEQVSLKDMLTYVCAMFNCRWFIDSNNDLRIEHVSFFENNLSYNATNIGTAIDISNEVGVRKNNKYNYDNARLYDIVRMNMTESGGLEFKGIDLVINTTTNTDERSIKELTVNNITTDLDYIKNNIDSISNGGFVMMVVERERMGTTEATNYVVVNDVCPILGLQNTNALLSASYLFQEFYTNGIPYNEAYVNGNLISTNKVLRNKKQATCQIGNCTGNINPYTIYKTGLGYATIQDMEHKMTDKTLILNLIAL